MSSEKFSLKWNDFEKNISASFKDLKDDEDLFDVTLACGDDEVSAHKVILSACSPFFRTVLKRHKHHHPLLYLHGFSFSNLKSVLNFMYLGEVSIAQDELNSFLSIAEELQVKGLTQSGDPLQQKQPPQTSRPRQRSSRQETVSDDDIQEVLHVKSEAADVEDGGNVVAYSEEHTDNIGYDEQHYATLETDKQGELI